MSCRTHSASEAPTAPSSSERSRGRPLLRSSVPHSRASMILVNSEARSEISVMDRGLAYGDGVFRTLPARDGRPLLWPRHYAKLAHDAGVLKLQIPEADVLENDVRAVCKDHAECAVKIVLTRGHGPRGYAYRGDE